jgi:lipid II:glycine glycyltransferase (peptidoglycan interpeptide bridge formation enzyme)
LRLEPNALDAPPWHEHHSALLLAGFEPSSPMQPEASIHLDLTPLPDALFAKFSKGHRADVRRAERLGVTVEVGTTEADFQAFYAVMQSTAMRANFGIHTADYYRSVWHLFNGQEASGAARLLLARHDDAVVAAFLVLAQGAEAQYMYSGSTEAGMKVGANHTLQWAAIQWARERGSQLYDCWGIPEAFLHLEAAQDPRERERLEAAAQATGMAGVYRFKKGWGGLPVRYVPAYDWVVLRPMYWLWQRRRGD